MLFRSHLAPQIGAKFIVLPHFAPGDSCALIEREGVTGAAMVPTMIARIVGLPNLGDYDLSSLRFVMSGGGMLPYEVGARFEDATGAKIIQGYGLMDYGALASHALDDPREMRLRSHGRLMPGTEWRVFDEAGRPLGPNASGEIHARGPHCNGGYIGESEATRSAWRDGFFRTGDVGVMDEQGRVKIIDRKKDMISVSGFKVFPNEVEDVAMMQGGILECAAIGVPDPHSGEAVKLFAVKKTPDTTAEELREFLSSRLAGYKVPRQIEFRAELPKTNVGKILRRALRDEP